MKKLLSLSILSSSLLLVSDPITIDSLFKNQSGIRSITSLSFLSSGNPNVYSSYPTLTMQGDPVA